MNPHQYLTASSSPEQTHALGVCLGREAPSGGVIGLSGELGAGKTCLAQGIAKGLDVPQDFTVTSPSFAIVNEYPGRIRLYHVDLYRVGDLSELEEIGLEDMVWGNGVTVIEWADKLSEALPERRLDISIAVTDREGREFCLTPWGQDAINWVQKCVDANVVRSFRQR